MLSKITLKALTNKQIIEKELQLEGLWMLSDGDQTIGPFDTSSLKKYITQNENMFDNIQAANLAQNIFINIFSHPHFQRRSPRLVDLGTFKVEGDFYILISGIKKGPFSIKQIEQFLADNTVMRSHQMSADNGKTWFKIYEHCYFDRRDRKVQSALPNSPNYELVTDMDEFIPNVDQDTEAMVGLAFIGGGHDKGQSLGDIPPGFIAKKKSSINLKYTGVFFASVFIALIAISNLQQQSDEKTANIPIKTKPVAINNSPRKPKLRNRVPASIEPRRTTKKSIVKAKKSLKVKAKKKKAPRRITHYADEFDETPNEERLMPESVSRDLAAIEEPLYDNVDELTQEQIEAIELGDPELIDTLGDSEEDFN
ncbi:MAG: hypothetical protein N4A33_00135 [Bacteriovoracaceae bacterium]|jgi:phage FluMu protein gp41|nr:hypothetical protein [Bacteriovoracaceae bacterium]